VKQRELFYAATAVMNEYQQHVDTLALRQKVNAGQLTPLQGVQQAKAELEKKKDDLSSELGRKGSIPRLTSGLDYINAIVAAIAKHKKEIGRIEINKMDLDAARDNGTRPQIKLRLVLNGPQEVDALVGALKESPAVKEVPNPNTNPTKDNRLEVSNFDIDLKPDYEPRRVVKEAPVSKETSK
jgi:hypothetical protein